MKKITAMIMVVALILGVSSLVLAKENTELAKQDVHLTVKVANWAELSNLEPMAVALAQPGQRINASQPITVQTNTNVTVSVSEPTLTEADSQILAAKETGALKWGLGFARHCTPMTPGSSFKVDAGSADTRNLIFWAEWAKEDWWTLIAGNYSGTATVTIASME